MYNYKLHQLSNRLSFWQACLLETQIAAHLDMSLSGFPSLFRSSIEPATNSTEVARTYPPKSMGSR